MRVDFRDPFPPGVVITNVECPYHVNDSFCMTITLFCGAPPVSATAAGLASDVTIKIGIKSPHKMVACFTIRDAAVTRSWASGLDEPCAN